MAGEVQLQIRNGPQGRGPACKEGQERRQQGREGKGRDGQTGSVEWGSLDSLGFREVLVDLFPQPEEWGNPFSSPAVGAGKETVWLGGRSLSLKMQF